MSNRYPLDPLAQAMGMSIHAACERLGVSGTTQKDYRSRGVTWRVADTLAGKAGYHVTEIWPEWGDDAMVAAEIECAAADCAERFIPGSRNQKYCSDTCGCRQRQRDRYSASEAERERRKDARRRYYAENGRYERYRQRRYDRARREGAA